MNRTDADWTAARAVAERWATVHGGAAASIATPLARVPYLFEATLPDTGLVLVHRGAVVEAAGLDALARYLDEAGVYPEHALTVDDVLELVHHFRALPPLDAADGAPQSYLTDDGDERGIGFAWHGDELELTLSYLLTAPAGDDDDGDGPRGPLAIAQWTLRLGPGVTPRWTERRRAFDPDTGRFVP